MKLSELLNVLKTAETAEEMDVRREEIAALIPAVRTMFGYDQKNSAHQYDLWMHSLHVVCNLPRRMENDMVYLAALLHDIGKPEAQCRGNARVIRTCITTVIPKKAWKSCATSWSRSWTGRGM